MDKLMRISKILRLTEYEKHIMFDLEGKNTIDPKLPECIISSEKGRVALRKARKVITEEELEKFIQKLNTKQQEI